MSGLRRSASLVVSLVIGARPAPPGQRGRLAGHPSGVTERATQEQLDVGVEAAELVVGPAHEGVVHRRVDAE
jgi:hypothetical protein